MDSVQNLLKFIQNSPSPFHAVEESRQLLLKNGFQELNERQTWRKLQPLGKYFFTRNKSSIVAFAIGGKYVVGNGFSIVAAHTDSPCLKIKPISKKSKKNYLQVGVQTYGGGLWHTWFDRDLSLAGRVVIDNGKEFTEKLVNIEKPILRIPTLAIHLDRAVNDQLVFNKETHLCPILSLSKSNNSESTVEGSLFPHHESLLKAIADHVSAKVNDLRDMELCLYDAQPPTVGGIEDDFIFSARLDNLLMSFTALEGFILSLRTLNHNPNVAIVSLFDNEEVGSESAYGAGSNLLMNALERISESLDAEVRRLMIFDAKKFLKEAVQKSLLVSADVAHAVHPNYSEKHEENHQPLIHNGTVIKLNASQRYATTCVTTSILKKIAQNRNIPLQEFVVKNDSPCGSTIGPILSSSLGIRTIDVGNAQLSMHSIREVCGTKDVSHAINLFHAFFEDFPEVDEIFQ